MSLCRRAPLALAAVLWSAGCATNLERPVEPFESEVIEVAPNAWYQACLPLLAGDRLLFSYVADPPMAFAIQEQTDDATISYIMRDLAREEGGIFFVPRDQDYCLRWTPSPVEVEWPTLLRYSVRLNAPK